MPAHNRAHYSGNYRKRAKAVRDYANASTATRCWRCGRTLAEHAPHHNGKAPTWQAGHTVDKTGPLAAEASTCNLSAGAVSGNVKRVEPQSKRWW